MLMRPILRYSVARDAYVLRVVGRRVGPVLRLDRRPRRDRGPRPDRWFRPNGRPPLEGQPLRPRPFDAEERRHTRVPS
jgi:hypothetical protein